MNTNTGKSESQSFGAVGTPDADLDFRKLIEASPIAFFTTDLHGKLTFYNQAAVNLWGRSPDLGIEAYFGSMHVFSQEGELMLQEDLPISKVLRGEAIGENERILIQRPDGSFKNLLVFPQPILDSDGKITGAHNTLVDVTEQQNSEIRRATLSAIVESSDDAIISKNLDGVITSWNQGAERIFKYSEKEIIGKNIKILIPASRQKDEDTIMTDIQKGKRVDHFETIRLDKFGKKIPLSLMVSPVRDVLGRIIGTSLVGRDISDRIHREERQAVLSAIVESSLDAIISKDLNGIIMSWNKGAEQIFGYKEKEVVGKSVTILIPEERLAEEELILKKIRSGHKVQHFETKRLHKSGRQIDISITVSPIRDSTGLIIGASKIARDIGERIRTETQMRKHARHLEILNGLGKSISKKMEVQGILQQVTDATTKLTGAAFGAFFYNELNADGEDVTLFTLSGADRSAFEKFAMPGKTELANPGFSAQGILRIDDISQDAPAGLTPPPPRFPTGSLPVKSYLSIPVFSTAGTVMGGLVFGHPEPGVFKQEHEDLISNIASQAGISLDNSVLFERVKSLSAKKDEFIAVASHELKTPLTTIKGYLQVLGKGENDKMTSLFISKSLNQVNKLNNLVEDLLNMSRLEAGKLDFTIEEFDLHKMLFELAGTFRYTYKSHQLQFTAANEPLMIKGDKQRLEQAVVNFLTNAVKYSPGAHTVFLSLTSDNNSVYISIRDEGIGLTPAHQKKLFSRYYRAETTKGISGLGLGLYLTKEIITRHSGDIKVESSFGEGSEFTIILPRIWNEKTS